MISPEKLPAIILAGGMGTRLREVISDVPKPMASISGKPFLEHLILHMTQYNFSKIIISIGHMGNVIRSHFGSGERLKITIEYSDEDQPLGTAGALKKAANLFDAENFIVVNGDSFLALNYWKFIEFHFNNKALTTMGLAFVEKQNRFGKVEINNHGMVTSFLEKGHKGSGLINGGIYCFNRNILQIIPQGKVSLEYDIFPLIINNNLYGFSSKGFFTDIGVPKDYLSLIQNPALFLKAVYDK